LSEVLTVGHRKSLKSRIIHKNKGKSGAVREDRSPYVNPTISTIMAFNN
jgi:hypothetical protein